MDKVNILKLKPHFEYRVWAGNRIKKIFNLKQESIGEAWLISAYENKSSLITNLNLKQEITLLDFYNDKNNGWFFNNYNLKHKYPLLSKIIDAKDDLSVQIHPDDNYAKQFDSYGKTECWYILDTKENNNIVLGHNAKSLNEFKYKVNNNEWNELLKLQPIKKDDFVYVESTKIHAIKADTLIYELQQSSDITYRVYDYNRLDKGKPRKLHLNHVFNLIKTPDQNLNEIDISLDKTYLVKNNLFNLKKISNKGINTYNFNDANWIQIVIINGNGKIDHIPFKTYDCFLVKHNHEFKIDGDVELLISYV